MLDALLAAFPDSTYFEQRDIGADLRARLRASDIAFAAYLHGAGEWDMARHPAYPVYSITKTNTEDNAEIRVGYGSVVLSSITTGEMLVYPMMDYSGKTPAEKSDAPARPPSNIPRAKTYAVDDLWRTLTAKDLQGGQGEYQAFLHAGSFQSAPFRFKAVPGPKYPERSPFEETLRRKALPGMEPVGIPGAAFQAPQDMSIPSATGLTLNPGKPVRSQGSVSYPASGAFKFTGAWDPGVERLPIHFLVSVPEVQDPLVATLWLPKSKCRLQDGSYCGSFSFDLANLFMAPDGKAKPPEKAWIGVVHRGWQGPIAKFEFDTNP